LALNERVNRAAWLLRDLGVGRGERVAILSENRPEYIELQLACAMVGAAIACQNTRLTPSELRHCIDLVEPRATMVSERKQDMWNHSGSTGGEILMLGEEYEERLAKASPLEPEPAADPEDGLPILYTSGTTGLPKGAVISQRAELARCMVMCADLMMARLTDTHVVWSTLYHMIGAETAFGTLLCGGMVVLVDCWQPDEIAHHIAHEPIGYLALVPGTIESLIVSLEKQHIRPARVGLCGAMADLVSPGLIARITQMLGAPYWNSFGSTEIGIPPASAGVIPVGRIPAQLSKRQNSFCEVRLVHADGREVQSGTLGELLFRGPTLFSGYWNAPEVNELDFRDGWFHMGDIVLRNQDGTLDFVDRVKYLIKSGGENVYPAEIERVLLHDARVIAAVVMWRKDSKWGEVPVAVDEHQDQSLTTEDLLQCCRSVLAGYKHPKEIVFVLPGQLPRSITGKIQRHQIEAWLNTT